MGKNKYCYNIEMSRNRTGTLSCGTSTLSSLSCGTSTLDFNSVELLKQIDILKSQIVELTNSNNELKNSNEELKTDLDDAENECDELEAQIQQLQKKKIDPFLGEEEVDFE